MMLVKIALFDRVWMEGGAEAGDKAGPPVLGKGPWVVWAPDPSLLSHTFAQVTLVSGSVTLSMHPGPAAAQRYDSCLR